MNQSLWNYCLYIWFRSVFYFQNHEFQECYFTIFIYLYIIRVWMNIMHDIGSRCNKKYFLAHYHKPSQIKSIKKPKDGASGSLFCVWAHKCWRPMFEFQGSEHMSEWCGFQPSRCHLESREGLLPPHKYFSEGGYSSKLQNLKQRNKIKGSSWVHHGFLITNRTVCDIEIHASKSN